MMRYFPLLFSLIACASTSFLSARPYVVVGRPCPPNVVVVERPCPRNMVVVERPCPVPVHMEVVREVNPIVVRENPPVPVQVMVAPRPYAAWEPEHYHYSHHAQGYVYKPGRWR